VLVVITTIFFFLTILLWCVTIYNIIIIHGYHSCWCRYSLLKMPLRRPDQLWPPFFTICPILLAVLVPNFTAESFILCKNAIMFLPDSAATSAESEYAEATRLAIELTLLVRPPKMLSIYDVSGTSAEIACGSGAARPAPTCVRVQISRHIRANCHNT